MKLRPVNIIFLCFFIQNNIFSQWVQTDGPYGPTNISAIISNDSLTFIAATCGCFSSKSLTDRWDINMSFTFSKYAIKGDSLFTGGLYGGINMIDLSQTDLHPVPWGLDGQSINALSISDSCLFAGIPIAGFNKSAGFGKQWQWFNEGLPIDTGYIPPKFGGGFYLIRNVYSIDHNDLYVFAGTQRGFYRADPDDLLWESKNNGLPLKTVSLVKNTGDAIYICIEDTIYKSTDNGDSWEEFFVSPSKITSINKIENTLFITMNGQGIYQLSDNGSTWEPFNNGLSDLHVNTIGKVDTTIVCGTSNGGFYYFEEEQWKQNNAGIICSSIRSITATSDALFANDNDNVYLLSDRNKWSIISPNVPKSYFGSLASMDDTIFLSVEYNTSYYPYDQPFIMYSPDHGTTWKNLNSPVPFARDDAYRIYCHGNRLYVFEDEIMYYTDNLGSTWKEISLPGDYCNYFYDFMVYHSVPYAAACGNGEFIMLDENDNWLLLPNEGLPADRPINGLAYTDGVLYAYVDVHGMYVSRDNGNTWNQRTSGITLDYAYGIRSFVAYGYDDLFIATVNGVYYTGNHGNSWHSINSGLINKNISDIEVLNDTLYVGLSGNGVWKCALNDIPLSLPEILLKSTSIQIYPNPAYDLIRISNPVGNDPVVVEIYDLTGRVLVSVKYETDVLDVSEFTEGTYIISIITKTERWSGKLVISK